MSQPTWNDVDDFIDGLVIHYAGKRLAGVYGIPRGGTILAVMASHALGVPCLAAPCEGCLVVDDIADTGMTLNHYKQKGYQIATMYNTSTTITEPDYSMFVKGKEWIKFPWERVTE